MDKYFRFVHEDPNVRKNSSSGGAFTLISDYFLENCGIVYGCILDNDLNAVHVRGESPALRNQMRTSKYIQSEQKEMFSQVENDLLNERNVLYTGTPCQIQSILSYLNLRGVSINRLTTIDVMCHGVGSKRFFRDYLEYLEKKYKSKAVSVNFRTKRYKGQKECIEVCFENGEKFYSSSAKYDWFYSAYMKNYILRPSCYKCPFATTNRISDITIADHWGYMDDEAYSLIICNTKKGEKILDNYSQKLNQINVDEIHQPHMHHPCSIPVKYDEFWKIYNSNGYLEVQKWMGNNTISGKIKDNLTRLIFKLHIAWFAKKISKKISL